MPLKNLLNLLLFEYVANIFKATAGGKFAALNLVDTLAGNIREVLLSTAQEAMGRQRKRKQPWVMNDILDICEQRRDLKRERKSKCKEPSRYK